MTRDLRAFDTETHLFGPGNMAPRVVCLTWASKDGNGIVVGDDNIERWLLDTLHRALDGRLLMVGANVAYDMACLMNQFPSAWDRIWQVYDSDRVTCVQNRERLLDNATGELGFPLVDGKKTKTKYSLADIAKVRLGKHVEKGADTWRMRYAELDGVPLSDWPEQAVSYAVGDAQVTLEVYQAQQARAKHLGYELPTEYHEARAQLALHLMSVWGVEIDEPRVENEWNKYAGLMGGLVDTIGTTLVTRAGKADKDLFGVARTPLPEIRQNMNATRAMIEKYFPGEPPRTAPSKKFPEGQIQTSAEVIAQCGSPDLQALTEFNGHQKTCNTYLDKLFAPIIHARFWTLGAATARTSCSGPNLQNPPRKPGVRECIRARKGSVFLFTDFDSQEMRTLAQCCQDLVGGSKLAERYRQDRHFDPHLEFAAKVGRLDLAEAQARLKAKDPEIKKLRQHTKVANFGFPGGMMPQTFVSYAKGFGLDIDTPAAVQLRAQWFDQWPEMKPYIQHVKTLIGQAGYGTQVHPRSGFRRGLAGYTDSANGYFQHLAAMASKDALWEVTKKAYNDRRSAMYGSRPVLFVHDEIGMETPEGAEHEAALEMEATMVEAMERWTPDVPSAASATCSSVWSKQAERVEVDGRLVSWEEYAG